MTTETNGTSASKVLSVPAILAKLIVLQQRNALPDPTKMDAGQTGSAQVDLDSRAALDMWIRAMGCEGKEVKETAYSTGDYGYWINARDWAGTGWWVQVRAVVPDPAPKPPAIIDAETVAALEAVLDNCDCPTRPAPEIRGCAEDTLVEHVDGCEVEAGLR